MKRPVHTATSNGRFHEHLPAIKSELSKARTRPFRP
jgi:hypothetical protein